MNSDGKPGDRVGGREKKVPGRQGEGGGWVVPGEAKGHRTPSPAAESRCTLTLSFL